MDSNSRLIDVQKDLVIRFNGLYQNLKKESKERRTEERLNQYESDRFLLANKIKENHQQLVDDGCPHEHIVEFEEFVKTDNKFIEKLKEFYKAVGANYVTKADKTKISEIENDNELKIKLRKAEERVSELERHLWLKNSEPTDQSSRNSTREEKIDELLGILVKGQIEQLHNSQPKQWPGNSMLDVPEFAGDVSEYKAFRQIFKQSVSSQNLSLVDKFLKLRSKLRGSPKDAISSLYIENGSYDIAWEILDRNYLNPRQLLEYDVSRITNSIFVIKGQNAQSHIDCKNTFVNIAANIKQLKLTAIDVLVQFTILKMDNTARARFEDFLGGSQEIPTEEKLVSFLEKEARIYQNANINKNRDKDSKVPMRFKENMKTTQSHITTRTSKAEVSMQCFICGEPHLVMECATFLASRNREGLLRFHKICIYCTKHKYNRNKPCNSRRNLKCDKCDEKHITAMHPLIESSVPDKQKSEEDIIDVKEKENTTNSFLTNKKQTSCTILPTAIANIMGENGTIAPIRCLVDLGSESSYICSHIVQSLSLRKYKTSVKIKGISGKSQCSSFNYVNLRIKLKDPSLKIVSTKAFVLPSIADTLPSRKIQINTEMTNLADPYFNTPAFVGVLLGSDIAPQIFKANEPSKITEDGWLMQPTHLGWIVCGRGKVNNNQRELSTFVTMHESMMKINNDKQLSEKILKFYEIPEEEDIENHIENDYCEKVYQERHYRERDGRYVVPTPWKPDAASLGHSFRNAVKFFLSQENRWKNNEEHYIKSNNFMKEYLQMGHMSEVTNLEERFIENGSTHTLAYISIFRKDAVTTKLRNVFNASLPTSNGISLNDTMYEGEKLQCDIFNILTKMRSFKYFFSADIEKMFRQIKILPADKNKMRIVWRSNSQEQLKLYELNTVTYGTDAAPWQAIRTIHQCAVDNAPDSNVIKILKEAFYVDDLLYGGETIMDCKELINKIITTMNKGQFPLTKWLSNSDAVLEGIPSDKLLSNYIKNENANIKILGMHYDRESDQFFLRTKHNDKIQFTKRGFCSAAASVYDPLGFTLPVTMRSRLFVQGIWREKYGWDEALPDNLKKDFTSWLKDQEHLADIKFPRWLSTTSNNKIELIGFSDASGVAKAAVIYSRININGEYHVQFVAARGNVNKLNTPQIIDSRQNTIPKNELDAVVILIDLYEKVKAALQHSNLTFRIYLDSKVALSWIRSPSKNENKFIRKRVDKIQKYLKPDAINYVKSEENPADPASRGMTAAKLKNCSLWIRGPAWLSNNQLPNTPIIDGVHNTFSFITQMKTHDMFERISKFVTLIRVITFMRRWKQFKNNPQSKKVLKTRTNHNFKHSPVTAVEVEEAKIIAIRYYQHLYLNEEYEKLSKNQPLNKKHWLRTLSPFIDERKLICVGGRLRNADITQSQRHPIIIPPGRFTKMIIEYTHLSNLHAGNSLTIQKLITKYYIKSIKRCVYHVVNSCSKCLRWKARIIQPEMSQLPKERVESGAIFEKVGVDLAGPMQIKANNLRNSKIIKIWVAVFVCLVTKATHLEIVSSLTTEDFLAALSRMTSRRGQIKEIWSDNGTNFQGASRIFKESWDTIVENCIDKLSIQEVKWKFIPRHSPTFGGLWEACVKSMKYFVKRMEPTTNFTYEEFYTLLCRIESLLNSRPLYSNPVEPSESLSLTPFHFITNRSFDISPIDAVDKNIPLTKKWLTIIQIQRDFWKKFNSEYLYSLQKKQKWFKSNPNLKIDDVVLIKEPNSIPGHWKMGKISKLYSDPQGVVRKADVSYGNQKKSLEAINQLVPLIPEETETFPSIPVTRSNVRKTKLSATQVLITLLTLTSVANAFSYTLLSPGVHIIKLNEVYLKATDLNLTIETQLNLTQDISILNSMASELLNYCENLNDTPNLKSYCLNVSEIIDSRAHQAATKIMDIYELNKRNKRWLSGILTGVKGLAKALPWIITAGGIAYQEYEIHNLNNEKEIMKERLQKTSKILLKITELEHDEVDEKLTNVLKIQKEENIRTEINSYMGMIFPLIEMIQDRQSSIIHLKPYKELEQQYQDITKSLPNVMLAPVEKIFSISQKQILYSETGKVQVNYQIPLVQKHTHNLYGIFNIPDEGGYIIDLQNNHYMEVIMNNENTSYYSPTSDSKISDNIYTIKNWRNVSGCLSVIFHRNNTIGNCNDTILPITSNKIIQIGHNLLLALSVQNITILCENKQASFYGQASIISISDCIVQVGSELSSINRHIDINEPRLPLFLNPPILKEASLKTHHHTELNHLRKQLKNILEDDRRIFPTGTTKAKSFPIISLILVFISIIVIIVIAKMYCRSKRASKSNQQNTNWKGPDATEYHMVPHGALLLEVISPTTQQN